MHRERPGPFSLPASVLLPGNAQIFGTTFLPGSTSYLLGPGHATCRPPWPAPMAARA